MSTKILVVDDNFDDLQHAKKILEANNFTVVIATNGAQALDQFKEQDFDLLLLDIQMPTLSGYDLLCLLREKSTKKIPMAYVSVVPKQEANLRDSDGFVQKPYTEAVLLKEVKRLLK